ncbi:MAG TPA: hypothetical protein VG846_04105, partial [Actinomycetota bacterium]|nr:hypothetical protein [Actinomycetota bacterium]
MRVLVQFRSSPEVHAATLRGEALPDFAAITGAPIPGLVIDPAFNPVQVPTPQADEPGASPYLYSPAVSFSMAPEQATYLVRGTLPDDPGGQRLNLAHLESRGRDPRFSRQRSWAPAGVAAKAGRHPVGHGTMCAYDVGIAAPKATLVDHALLLSETPGETSMSGLLSDA